MSGQHTPGPWSVVTYSRSDVVNVRGAQNFPVAQAGWLPDEGGLSVTIANARLIAAAPELLGALEEYSREYDGFLDGDGEPCPTLMKARRAIAKARGVA